MVIIVVSVTAYYTSGQLFLHLVCSGNRREAGKKALFRAMMLRSYDQPTRCQRIWALVHDLLMNALFIALLALLSDYCLTYDNEKCPHFGKLFLDLCYLWSTLLFVRVVLFVVIERMKGGTKLRRCSTLQLIEANGAASNAE